LKIDCYGRFSFFVSTMKIVFATQNQNKISEVQNVLPDFFDILGLADMNCFEELPETSNTLQGNAIQKAQYIYQKYNVNCFSDDTGLEVEALDGEPGVFSARYAGAEKSSENNMNLLLSKLENVDNRAAQFRTVIALILDSELYTFEGIVKGEIRNEKSGNAGFGYDPIFVPENCGMTFAEMSTTQKNNYSHRARAFEKMVAFLNSLQLKQ